MGHYFAVFFAANWPFSDGKMASNTDRAQRAPEGRCCEWLMLSEGCFSRGRLRDRAIISTNALLLLSLSIPPLALSPNTDRNVKLPGSVSVLNIVSMRTSAPQEIL
jgi:hypothetical protein